MNVLVTKLEDFLKRDSKMSLTLLNKLLLTIIPFNAPHKFKIEKLSETNSRVLLPFIRKNKNHLNTVHACSMATIGEYAAGLILLKNFSISKNRLIMKDLNITFYKQAKEKLFGISELSQAELSKLINELDGNEKVVKEMLTTIQTESGENIAEVKTTWQLKRWDKVKFK